MKKEKDLRFQLLMKTKENKEHAWLVGSYDESLKIREREKKDYEKWKLLDGIIKAKEKKDNVKDK